MQANDAAIKLRQNSQLVERGAALPNMLKSKFLRPELTLFKKGNTMKKLTVTNVNAVDTKHPATLLVEAMADGELLQLAFDAKTAAQFVEQARYIDSMARELYNLIKTNQSGAK